MVIQSPGQLQKILRETMFNLENISAIAAKKVCPLLSKREPGASNVLLCTNFGIAFGLDFGLGGCERGLVATK